MSAKSQFFSPLSFFQICNITCLCKFLMGSERTSKIFYLNHLYRATYFPLIFLGQGKWQLEAASYWDNFFGAHPTAFSALYIASNSPEVFLYKLGEMEILREFFIQKRKMTYDFTGLHSVTAYSEVFFHSLNLPLFVKQ